MVQFFQNELHNFTYKFGLRPTKYKEQALVKQKLSQKKVNRIMKIMQSIIWFAYWIMLEIVNSVISDIIDVLPQKGSSYFT